MSDRAISEQQLLHEFLSYYTGKERDGELSFVAAEIKQHFADLLSVQPTVEAGPKWIPCSERPPEECEEVNITWVNTNPPDYYADLKGKPLTGSGLYCRGRWYWYSVCCRDYLLDYGVSQGDEVDDDIKVIAWRPMPEPYKEVSHE